MADKDKITDSNLKNIKTSNKDNDKDLNVLVNDIFS